ncbi:MAG TPA: Ail/Lom family protein, partial [Leclercia adecarboxylata]|nr:Ail/Lom family protein [Leclercia adecarboxylata]
TKWINATLDYTGHDSLSEKSTSFAYGAGLMINPVENVSMTLGYEGTEADLNGNYAINGFILGIGYRF